MYYLKQEGTSYEGAKLSQCFGQMVFDRFCDMF